MTGVALWWAVATAVSFGAADFLGGLASRRAPVLPVVLVSQIVAALVMAAFVVVEGAAPTPRALAWGAAGGATSGLAFLVYYRGLAIGRMGLVSTVTAVCSALVPVLVGVVLGGERPGTAAVAGMVVSLVAVVLLSSGGSHADDHATPAVAVPAATPTGATVPDEVRSRATSDRSPADGVQLPGPPGLVEGAAAGIGYGAFFICIERVGEEGGAGWPLLAAALATVVVVFGIVVARRVNVATVRPAVGLVVVTGVLQLAGGLAVLLSVRAGPLSLVAVVAALSPVPTMLLARAVLAERLARPQVAGVALALVGVALIAGN